MSSPAISLENVSVRYRVPRERVSGLKEYAIRWAQRRLSYQEFWALDGVSFSVQKGEAFGVIGRNGSGKSTLLKVVARVLHPTRGRLTLDGAVAPLLELGAGFHPELTGRENVFLNSALLGRTRRETERLLPEIIEFSELPDFIEAPLRTYSTGMAARLGFAVATAVRPQILLVDEVLSVGDAPFQRKCLDRMDSFRAQGTTILFVSHGMSTIETFCERALWLNRGKTAAVGDAADVIGAYVDMERPAPQEQTPGADGDPARLRDFTPLGDPGGRRPAEGILDIGQGAFSAWLRLRSDRPFRDCVLFHSDDSRFVVYLGAYFAETAQRDVHVLVARAGGNRRAVDTYYGSVSFPEIAAAIDAEQGIDFPPDAWRHICVTWQGYPKGKLRLYIGGQLLGEREYDSRFDNRSPLPREIAVGFRPPEWLGELVEQEDGRVVDARPQSALALADSNAELRSARLYRAALTESEVQSLARLEA